MLDCALASFLAPPLGSDDFFVVGLVVAAEGVAEEL